MADRHGSVLLQKHHGGRFSHHQTSAHHYSLFSGTVDLIMIQDFHTGLGGTGRKSLLSAGKHAHHGAVCNAVHIFCGIQRPDYRLFIQMSGQGAEDQHSMDTVVLIDLTHSVHENFLGYIRRQQDFFTGHPQSFTALYSAPLIGEVVFPLSYPDNP